MIHVAIGTKAQFIKMAPILREFKARGEQIALHDMAQHKGLTPEIREIFDIADIPRQEVVKSDGNASSIAGIMLWTLKFLKILILGSRAYGNQSLAIKPGEQVLVHGDTLSTLYGALLARRMGGKVALVEAGLTSKNLFNPFPEEIVRRCVQKLSNSFFCPGEAEFQRIKTHFPHKNVYDTHYNTGRDSVTCMLPSDPTEPSADSEDCTDANNYILCTIHRFETISSSASISRMVDYICTVAQRGERLIFCMHEPTEKYLNKFQLLDRITSNASIQVMPLQPYNQFLQLIHHAKLVITDGGSIQEECYTLSKPCIIFRKSTERDDGLGNNAILTGFDVDSDIERLEQLNGTIHSPKQFPKRATDIVVDEVLAQAR